MSYRVGDKVWVCDGTVRTLWHRGVITHPQGAFRLAPFEYGVDVEGYPPPLHIGSWTAKPTELRPRDDGNALTSWSDCAWKPVEVPA